MADNDGLIPALLLGAAAWYVWKNKDSLFPSSQPAASTSSASGAGIFSQPAFSTPTYASQTVPAKSPAPMMLQQQTVPARQDMNLVPASMADPNVSVRSNPYWNPGGSVSSSNTDAAAIAALDAAASKGSTLMQSAYTGRSAPDAPPDAIWTPQQLWHFQNCTYITGELIQPPPPGC